MSTVLVVDDDPAISEILATALVDAGYEASAVSSGEAALRFFEDQPVDLVVTDIMMPVVSGYQLLERVRARDDGPPVILMSAGARPARTLGHAAFLAKPFDLEQLLAAIDRALGFPSR